MLCDRDSIGFFCTQAGLFCTAPHGSKIGLKPLSCFSLAFYSKGFLKVSTEYELGY